MEDTQEILNRIQPENSNVLVKPIDETIKKVGSLYAVSNAHSRNRAHTAEVIKTCIGSKLNIGDVLFFNAGAIGTDISINGENFKSMREQDILVRLKNPNTDPGKAPDHNQKCSHSFRYTVKPNGNA